MDVDESHTLLLTTLSLAFITIYGYEGSPRALELKI